MFQENIGKMVPDHITHCHQWQTVLVFKDYVRSVLPSHEHKL